MANPTPLPDFIRPMLARKGQPFDSGEHVFEVKWDGIRAVAFVDHGGYRLLSRHGQDMTEAFPELAVLARLPPGAVLDGELVVFERGRPDLGLVLGRCQLQMAHKIRARARSTPASYITFDQLYDEFAGLVGRPLSVRREILRQTIARAAHERLVFSDGVVGPGRAFYQQVIRRNLEGVVAKRLTSPYRPGQRGGAWIKIKPQSSPPSGRWVGSLKV